MINFLPPNIKSDITYKRKNKALISWLVILLSFILIIILTIGFGIFFINQKANNLNRLVTVSEQRITDQDLESYQKKAESFSNNLETAIELLKDQLLFSKIIKTIGATLPPNTKLEKLEYSTANEILTLNIKSPDQNTISVAYKNIQESGTKENSLFSKADLLKVLCSAESNECTGTIVVLLNKNSNYYLLNNLLDKTKEAKQ